MSNEKPSSILVKSFIVAYGQQVEFLGPSVDNVNYVNGSETVNITYINVSSIELRNPSVFEVRMRVSIKI